MTLDRTLTSWTRSVPGRYAVITVCPTPRASSASVSRAVWICMPPTASNPTDRVNASGGAS